MSSQSSLLRCSLEVTCMCFGLRRKLLKFCQMVIAELQIPPAGDYIRNALKGQQFYKGSQPRWEALCGICGFAVLYHATGQKDLSTAYQQIWWSLCEYERHNQGGMMSGEQARGDPYNTASEETCCTVTWGAMCVEMLKLTGNSVGGPGSHLLHPRVRASLILRSCVRCGCRCSCR